MLFIRLLRESYLFALNQLRVNLLRTFLSLLGITIGIFTVISVFTIFDSLQYKIKNSIESLGDNVLYVQKWPWEFNNDFPWWKYFQRPVPSIDDAKEIGKRSLSAQSVAFVLSAQKSVEYKNKSMENQVLMAASHEYQDIFSFELSEGRYFSTGESVSGKPVAIIGNEIATTLFGNKSPIGEKIEVFDTKFTIIGVFKKEGEDIFSNSHDGMVLIPINYARNILNVRSDFYNPFIAIKAKEGITNEQLKDEVKGIMRSIRSLKPKAEDNFSINEITSLTSNFEGIFATLSIVGWVIGGLSLLVGGFGIANIMFVSVKERTKQIGIQKSLGAKNFFILFQFLFESVFLSLFGGILGLILVFMIVLGVKYGMDFDLTLTISNISTGLSVSLVIGIVAGVVPAISASKLNPVEAIRTN